jgi:hypothetical protein
MNHENMEVRKYEKEAESRILVFTPPLISGFRAFVILCVAKNPLATRGFLPGINEVSGFQRLRWLCARLL